jgi:DNA polymerase-3 subunit beta
MKFICTKENLIHALNLVSGVSSKQNNLPILSNILIEVKDSKVELISTDLEIAIKVYVRAKVEEAGSFTVPAKTLNDVVSLAPSDNIDISLEDNEIVVKSGSSNTKIKGASADDFPVIPGIEEEKHYLINSHQLRDSLSKVVVASAKNEIRPELSGIFFNFFSERFNGLILAATDSYRLAEKKVEVSQGKDVFDCIVPSKTIIEIIRLISIAKTEQAENDIRLWVSENQIAVRYGSFEMTSRLVSGKYPDYAQIIPSGFKTNTVVQSDMLVKQIKAASLFTTGGVNAVSFDCNIENQTISISSTSTQTGEHLSEIDAQVSGEENSILLNHRYVLDGLQQISGNEIEFLMNTGDTPCMFRQKNDEKYLYIVMPIRQ